MGFPGDSGVGAGRGHTERTKGEGMRSPVIWWPLPRLGIAPLFIFLEWIGLFLTFGSQFPTGSKANPAGTP